MSSSFVWCVWFVGEEEEEQEERMSETPRGSSASAGGGTSGTGVGLGVGAGTPRREEALVRRLGTLVERVAGGAGVSEELNQEMCVQMLRENVSSYPLTKVSVLQMKRKLLERAGGAGAGAFAGLYDRVAAHGAPEADKFLSLMLRVAEEPGLMRALQQQQQQQPGPAAAGKSGGDGGARGADVERSSLAEQLRQLREDRERKEREEHEAKAALLSAQAAQRQAGPGPLGRGGVVGAASSSARNAPPTPPAGAWSPQKAPAESLGVTQPTSVLPPTSGLASPREPPPPPPGVAAAAAAASPRRPGDVLGAQRASAEAAEAVMEYPALGPDGVPAGGLVGAREDLVEGRDYPAAAAAGGPPTHARQVGTGRRGSAGAASLRALGPEAQEEALVEDLLSALTGVEGLFVRRVVREDGRGGVDGAGLRGWALPGGCCDASLGAIAGKVLPLCLYHSVVSAWVGRRSGYRFGQVSQAVAASMKDRLRDFYVLVAQLEHQHRMGRLTLHRMWYYAQQHMRLLRSLAVTVCAGADGANASECAVAGAPLLDLLAAAAAGSGGDPVASEALSGLLRAACAPYAAMLRQWLTTGDVDDRFHEFMVATDGRLAFSDRGELVRWARCGYWFERASLRPGGAPDFLKRHADAILGAGKYLDAVRECGTFEDDAGFLARMPAAARELALHGPPAGPDRDGGKAYAESVEAAQGFASAELLRLLLSAGPDGGGSGGGGGSQAGAEGRPFAGLRTVLGSLKTFMLTDRADWLATFMEVAEGELSRPTGDVRLERLQPLLDMAVKASSVANDPGADALQPRLEHAPLVPHLTGLLKLENEVVALDWAAVDALAQDEADGTLPAADSESGATGWDMFSLSLDAPWPASIVVNRRASVRYQLLFRHVFAMRRAERELCATAQRYLHTKALVARVARSAESGIPPALSQSFGLCQRMLHLVRNLVHYTLYEVLEPHWHTFFALALGPVEGDQQHADGADVEAGRGGPQRVTDVDGLVRLHDDFLDAALRDCMLLWPRCFKLISRLLETSLTFASQSVALVRAVDEAEAESTAPPADDEDDDDDRDGDDDDEREPRRKTARGKAVNGAPLSDPNARELRRGRAERAAVLVRAVCEDDAYVRTIERMQHSFDKQVRDLILLLKAGVHIEPAVVNLVSRLDYNNYYQRIYR